MATTPLLEEGVSDTIPPLNGGEHDTLHDEGGGVLGLRHHDHPLHVVTEQGGLHPHAIAVVKEGGGSQAIELGEGSTGEDMTVAAAAPLAGEPSTPTLMCFI